MVREALQYVSNMVGEDRGKTVLFVGTKRQAQDAVREEAERSGQYYVNQRWLGGLLTNFQTVQKSIKRLKDLAAMQTAGRYEKLSKKEPKRTATARETAAAATGAVESGEPEAEPESAPPALSAEPIGAQPGNALPQDEPEAESAEVVAAS